MKNFLGSFLGALLAILVLIGIVGGVAYVKMNEKSEIEDRSWLVMDLYGQIPMYPPPAGPLGAVMGGGGESLHRILDNLEKARHDDRIEGVILKVADNGAGLAGMQEIRNAVKRLRSDGKRVLAWTDSFNQRSYYLMAACEEIHAAPSAYISFTGMGATTMHVKKALEKLGVKPQIHKIKDYKSAAEIVTRENMSPEARENDEWLIEGIWERVMADIAADRDLSEADLVSAMEKVAMGPAEAAERGLIDGLLYWDQLQDSLKDEDDDELPVVASARYGEEDREDFGWKGDKKIAVVNAQGSIGGRKTRVDPLMGPMMGHESVVADLRAAREDEDVVAIVFRVDSGGGESLASDLICHEVDRCAEEKPVICSMVNVAASGGYYVAYKATKVMADPLCITGSIGSISGKFNMSGFWDKLGVTHDHVSKGPNPYFWSMLEDWDEKQWELFTEDHWRGFNEWLADVAVERGMSFEEAELLAHGRVYTGSQAVENGLIDATGDLYGAIQMARELADVPEDEEVSLVNYPEGGGGILDLITGGGDLSAAADLAVYRYLREDLAETWRAVSQRIAAEDIPVP